MNGTITTWFKDKGFGFIKDENGDNRYFHVIKVANPDLIKKDAAVTFEPTTNNKGLSAYAVKVIPESKYLYIAGERVKLTSIKSFVVFSEEEPADTGIDKENNRIITAMLNEMDGFTTKDGILVVAATNSYRSLDPALVRPGRFDLKYTVSNPDMKTREELIRIYSQGKSLAEGLAPARLAPLFEGASCADVEATLNEAAMLAVLEKAEVVTLELVIRAAEKVGVKLKI